MNLLVLAQAATAPAPGDPFAVAKVALRRFFSGSTLCAPESIPSAIPIQALALGVGLLVLLVVVHQGPRRALKQLFDVPGHARAVQSAIGRFRRSGRMAAALFGSAVLAWTVWQSRFFANQDRLEDLSNLLRRKSVSELAAEQGILAALTPLRDLCTLSGNLVMLLALAVVIFKVSADRWNMYDDFDPKLSKPLPRWTSPAWAAAWAFTLYRIACLIWRPDGQPLGILPIAEVVLVPPLMLICDALLLAWVLCELRHGQSDSVSPPLTQTVSEAIERLPAAALVCLLVMPSRYVAATASLAIRSFSGTPPAWVQRLLATVLIDWGLVWFQCAGFVFISLVGAAALARDGGGLVRVWRQTLRTQGARMLVLVLGTLLATGGLTFLAYLSVLSLPGQPWVLAAADSYAHYVSLPLGLILVAMLVELAHQSSSSISMPRPEGDAPSVLEFDEATPAAASVS